MKIIDRYILKQLIGPFIFGFLFFNFILLIAIIFELTELIFVENAPPLEVGKLILFDLPSLFDIIIPVALLFAGLVSFGKFSSEGEIMALRSSGVSLFQIGRPLWVLVLILTLVSLYFSAYLTPWCNQNYQKTYRRIILQRPTLQIKEKIITDLKGKKFYTYRINPENHHMQGIVLYEFPSRGASRFPRISLAKEGEFKEEVLQLKEVILYQFGENYRIAQQGKFDSQTIYLGDQFSQKITRGERTEEMTLGELRKRLREERAKKEQGQERARRLAVDFHSRTAIPLATLFLGLLAIPLGIKLERGEKSISLGVSLIIIIIYYVFFLAGKFLGRAGLLPPSLAMWLPNLLLMMTGIWLNLKFIKV